MASSLAPVGTTVWLVLTGRLGTRNVEALVASSSVDHRLVVCAVDSLRPRQCLRLDIEGVNRCVVWVSPDTLQPISSAPEDLVRRVPMPSVMAVLAAIQSDGPEYMSAESVAPLVQPMGATDPQEQAPAWAQQMQASLASMGRAGERLEAWVVAIETSPTIPVVESALPHPSPNPFSMASVVAAAEKSAAPRDPFSTVGFEPESQPLKHR